jgi:hypothetical protein
MCSAESGERVREALWEGGDCNVGDQQAYYAYPQHLLSSSPPPLHTHTQHPEPLRL